MIEAKKNFNKFDPRIMKKKSQPENSNHNNWSLIHTKKEDESFFLLCVDKATHMKLNEIMFLLSHGSVTA